MSEPPKHSRRHPAPAIDVSTLMDVAEHFRFRWDPPILAELGHKPSRFGALASRLETHIGERLDDNALSRSLARLTRTGLVTADYSQIGRRDIKVYRLTDQGHQRTQTYETLVTAYSRQTGNAHHDDCFTHDPHETPPPTDAH